MHELSIASQLVDQVIQHAQANDAIHVREVIVKVGAMQLVVPEALHTAFEAVTEGTIAEGATLEIREVQPMAKCRACRNEFSPEIGNYVCPQCGQANAQIIQGNDIVLHTIECDIEEESTP